MESDNSTQCNILCLKWGTRYSPEYTNILYHSIKRHLHRPFRFVCCTDNPEGLDEGIETVPIPPNPAPDKMPHWPNIFLKLAIYKEGFANLKGPTLFFDVDVVIMEDIDCFFDYHPGEYCIIHNWIEPHKTIFKPRPFIGNSSIFRFDAGPKADSIYQTFLKEIDEALDPKCYTTEQAFMTHAMKTPVWWPENWVASYKRTCRPIFPLNLIQAPKKPNTKVLVFHGNPDPDQAIAGFKGKKLHHRLLPAPWIRDDWHK